MSAYSEIINYQRPILYLPMNERSGTTLRDYSGNGRDFAWVNLPTFGVQNTAISASHGEDYAASFDGSTSYAQHTSPWAWLPTVDISVSMWVRPDTTTQTNYQFNFEGDTNSAGASRISCHLPWSNGTCYWDFGDLSGGGRLSWATTAGFTAGSYHHVVLTAHRGTGPFMQAYIDNVLIASSTAASATTPNTVGANRTALMLGWLAAATHLAAEHYLGKMHHFAMWDRVLTAAEIAGQYNVRAYDQLLVRGG